MNNPAGNLHVDDAVGKFRDMLDEKLRRVPLGTRFHDREVVVDATAHTAAVVQNLSLLADDDVQPGFKGRNGRHATGNAATDHQHVCVHVRPFFSHGISRQGISDKACYLTHLWRKVNKRVFSDRRPIPADTGDHNRRKNSAGVSTLYLSRKTRRS